MEPMYEQRQEPLPQSQWSLEDAVRVLHRNGLQPESLSKLHGGIEFQVYSAQNCGGQATVIKYPSERWVYNDNDWGIDRFQLLRQERDLLRFVGEHGIPVPEIIAYFDPPDGPEVLVLEQINVDGTLPSDAEIGETVRSRNLTPTLFDAIPASLALFFKCEPSQCWFQSGISIPARQSLSPISR